MFKKLLLIICFLFFSFSLFADELPPKLGCDGKKEKSACTMEDGTAGSCQMSECEYETFMNHPVSNKKEIRKVKKPCLKCLPHPIQSESFPNKEMPPLGS